MRRIELWLLIAAVLIAAGWGLVWWLISSQVEGAVGDALATSSEGEVAVACEERRHRGFPFRFEVVCTGATAQAADGAWSARLQRVRAGALVRSPGNIEANLDGPLEVVAAALERPAVARWASGRGELVVGQDGPRRIFLRLFSTTVDVEGIRLMAHQGTAEVAPNDAGGSRLAWAVEQLRITAGERALPPFDLSAEAMTPIPAEALLSGEIDRSEGLSLSDIALSVETARVQAFAEGALEVDAGGWTSGSLTLHLVGLEELPALIEALPQAAQGGANVAVGALVALAAPAEWRGRPARQIVLTIEDGEVSAGGLVLGRLPPLWQEAVGS